MNENNANMVQVFSKLGDLKYVFQFGEKILPIIQSIIEFMKDVVPLLENINKSIARSTDDIPKASVQIDNVTSATELATTEILDLVDEITQSLGNIEGTLKIELERESIKEEKRRKLFNIIGENSEAKAAFDEYCQHEINSENIANLLESIAKISEDSYKITLSLQVQDITAQQLAATNHLISSVHSRLASLVNKIDKSEIRKDIQSLKMEAPENATFDPNASYAKDERQVIADNVISEHKSSQAEIDALINANKPESSDKTKEFKDKGSSKASQDEIDKLFS